MSAGSSLTRTILIVEHDEITLLAYSRILRLDGYGVYTASSTDNGLREAFARRPDAIVVSAHWPEIDGLEFLLRLRADERHRETPVGVVTGDVFHDSRVVMALHHLGATIRFQPLWYAEVRPFIGELLRVDPLAF